MSIRGGLIVSMREQTIKGWRIDYVMASEPLRHNILTSTMMQQAFHSDHCPVITEFDNKIF